MALQPGDTVVQNGANSAVGRNVIQLCRAAGPAAPLAELRRRSRTLHERTAPMHTIYRTGVPVKRRLRMKIVYERGTRLQPDAYPLKCGAVCRRQHDQCGAGPAGHAGAGR